MEAKQQTDLKDVFNMLESQETHVIEDIKRHIQENLSLSKKFSIYFTSNP